MGSNTLRQAGKCKHRRDSKILGLQKWVGVCFFEPNGIVVKSHNMECIYWFIPIGAKCLNQINTGGENISLTYSPDGNYVAVGTKVSQPPSMLRVILTTISERMTIYYSLIRVRIQSLKRIRRMFRSVRRCYALLLLSKLMVTQTNQIIWSHNGDVLFLTTGSGLVKIRDWPSLDSIHTIDAHTSACFCLELEPRGKWVLSYSTLRNIKLITNFAQFTCSWRKWCYCFALGHQRVDMPEDVIEDGMPG